MLWAILFNLVLGVYILLSCKVAGADVVKISATGSIQPRVIAFLWEGATAPLHNDGGSVSTSLAALSHAFAFRESCEETTDVRISSTVGVHKLLLRQLDDWILRNMTANAYDRIVDTLRNHNGTLATL